MKGDGNMIDFDKIYEELGIDLEFPFLTESSLEELKKIYFKSFNKQPDNNITRGGLVKIIGDYIRNNVK